MIAENLRQNCNNIIVCLSLVLLDYGRDVVSLYRENLFRIIFNLVVLVVLVIEKMNNLRKSIGLGKHVYLVLKTYADIISNDLYVDEASEDQEKGEEQKENDNFEVSEGSKLIFYSG